MTDLYAPIFRKFLFPFYEGIIRKRNTLSYLHSYNSHLNWSTEQVYEEQWHKLQFLLNHCFHHVPYYKNKWQSLGIQSIKDIKTMEEFSCLPVLTKNDVSQYYQELISDEQGNVNIHKVTGGSTGKPFRFEYNLASDESRQSVMWRGYGWLGAGLGIKTFHLWGADIGKVSKLREIKTNLYHKYYNRKIVSSFDMRKDNMSFYVNEINQYKPDALVAYVNPLYQLAKYIIEHNISIHSPSTIITGAEALFDFQREVIEKAFSCQTYNTYGCREFMMIAGECKEKNGLHINADHLIVETINDNGQSVMEESGELVITDLSNYGMPLIRYVNGDNALLTHESCSCGNPLPLMKKVDGRKLDVIKTPQGGMIPGEFFPHLLKEFPGIDKFQVRQKVLDEIDILFVANDNLSDDDLMSIESEFNRYSQGKVKVNFNKVNDIPLTASGKHRVTVCDVPDDE